ncbi:MAG: cellulase family glycosylhydrolase, partial [Pseudomonadota bacterium]|nr:cellulase family glycosylhydrolase [Pseudomonadota bacterium]
MPVTTLLRSVMWSSFILLAACGGDGSSTSADSTSAASTTTTTGTSTAPTTTTTTTTAANAVALSAPTYSASPTSGSLTVTVNRSGKSGAVGVTYTTANGTAVSGTDYGAASGALNWADGDTAARTFTIPIATNGSGGKTFSVALSKASGATLGVQAATVSIAPAALSTIALSASSYSASSGASTLTVTVSRTGSSSEAASVSYATANGTAVAGTDFTAANGTLSWASGEGASKSFAISVLASGTGGKSFTVALSQATGANLGTPASATVSIAAAPATSSSTLTISVSGNHFVDGSGKTVQLRGANLSGLEFVAVQGWDSANPWGSQTGTATPDWNAIKSWHINVVRLPLNEASWLGYQCVDATGAARDPDPGHNYQSTVKQTVASATAAGIYVILDLHLTAPKNFCPLAQNPMADADNSLSFWKSIAGTFKSYPNVLFELFNEPYVYWLETPGTEWQTAMQGGNITQYVTGGTPYAKAYTWKVAGMQQMLDTVRATGATNPVLIAGVKWAGDLSQWLANKPKDSLNQIAAVWHAYPAYGTTFGTAAYALPGGGQA